MGGGVVKPRPGEMEKDLNYRFICNSNVSEASDVISVWQEQEVKSTTTASFTHRLIPLLRVSKLARDSVAQTLNGITNQEYSSTCGAAGTLP